MSSTINFKRATAVKAFNAYSHARVQAHAIVAAENAAKARDARAFNFLLLTASLCSAVVALVMF